MQSSGSCSALFLASTQYIYTLSTHHLQNIYIYTLTIYTQFIHYLDTICTISTLLCYVQGIFPWQAGALVPAWGHHLAPETIRPGHVIIARIQTCPNMSLELSVYGIVDTKNDIYWTFKLQLNCGMVRISLTPTSEL